ncbi:DUF4258 domain-containing protein [Geminocystis sp. NIES-3708]|uniref:DUF4258 domain-containing protein n=1 Tax=Geminocystis sp. NIES-3708 TaxID=1615909 RepID=UPI000830A791|nr:DUF4258 domain-containing protein [Geminocystis sp. NIES-3708]
MNITKHGHQRMNQRGITKTMIELAIHYGTPKQDQYILNKKLAEQLAIDLQTQLKTLKKIIDKKGIVVVQEQDILITTYNC